MRFILNIVTYWLNWSVFIFSKDYAIVRMTRNLVCQNCREILKGTIKHDNRVLHIVKPHDRNKNGAPPSHCDFQIDSEERTHCRSI